MQLTENAIAYVKRVVEKSTSSCGIRINVKKAGCSGYEYKIEYAYPDAITADDLTFDFEGAQVVIDKEVYSKFFKGGTVMDFRKEGINEGVHFDNPNVENQCGCGESFTIYE